MSLLNCPTGCGRSRRQDHLMCPSCWRHVPRELQDDVYRAYRAWQRDLSDAKLCRTWQAARDAAIASLR